MKKRGQLANKAFIVIIVSAIVILAFINAGKSYGKQEVYYKLAVARDLAITIDLAYSLPGDFYYIYPNEISGYDIEFKDNSVRVYSSKLGKLDPTIASHSFAGLSADKLDTILANAKFLTIEKKGEKLQIAGFSKFEGGGDASGGAGSSRQW